jgi:putative ABC transport system substrate-binding protein
MRLTVFGLTLLLAFTGLSAPGSVDAQTPTKVVRIGTLLPPARPTAPDWKERWVLAKALRELGWVEGKNLAIEDRWAEGRTERFPALAAELVGLKVDVIVTGSWPAAVAAKNATTTIPIVFYGAGDPVGTGLVQSLARPGGNMTGLGDVTTDLSAKRLELLKEAVPKLSRVAVLWNAGDGGMTLRMRATQAASRQLHVTVRPLGVHSLEDFEVAFTAMTQERPDALFVVADPLVGANRKRILDFTAKHRLPAMYELRAYVADGGLMAYGPIFDDMVRRAAALADKILKGTQPADIPVEQPMRFELVLNMKTAKALGITFPPSILVRADEVIE